MITEVSEQRRDVLWGVGLVDERHIPKVRSGTAGECVW